VKHLLLALAFAMSLMVGAPCMAQATTPDAPIAFHDSAEEARFHALATSLRCVMCQNESLADSQAMIAHDLRRQILAMMRQGKTDAQIRDFLVARYGEFVLYQPRVEPATWPLWFGPLALLVVGGATVAFVVRRRSARLRRQAGNLGIAPAPEADASAESSEDW
jgi:cytochrome c-type biogenesis protein CcmH